MTTIIKAMVVSTKPSRDEKAPGCQQSVILQNLPVSSHSVEKKTRTPNNELCQHIPILLQLRVLEILQRLDM